MIIGNTRKLYPADIYGRGLVKLDNIYEFQTAHIFNDDDDNTLDKVIAELNSKYSMKAPKIPVVPENVLITDVIGELKDLAHVPVGINKENISCELFNLKDNYVTIISDNDDSVDRNNFVRSITKVMSKLPNSNLILIEDMCFLKT